MTSAVAWIAAATTALHLATANLWGYHRDEFYYLACGRRLAWGFVDHPPVTPLLYRLADLTVGTSKLGLRTAPGAAPRRHRAVDRRPCARRARRLGACAAARGAGRRARTPPAHHRALPRHGDRSRSRSGPRSPLVLVRLVNGGDPRLWLRGRRARRHRPAQQVDVRLRDRRTRASACCSATVTSSARRGCSPVPRSPSPSGRPTSGGRPSTAGRSWSSRARSATTARPRSSCPHSCIVLGAGAVLAVPGIVWLASNGAGRPYRFLLVAFVVALLATLLTGGKPYYTAAVLPALIAAGAVALDGSRGWVLPTVVVALGVALAPLAMPLTPRRTADALRAVNPELGEMVGWEQLAAQARTLHAQHPQAGLLTDQLLRGGSDRAARPRAPTTRVRPQQLLGLGPTSGRPRRGDRLGVRPRPPRRRVHPRPPDRQRRLARRRAQPGGRRADLARHRAPGAVVRALARVPAGRDQAPDAEVQAVERDPTDATSSMNSKNATGPVG